MGKNSNFRPQTVNMNITKKAEEPVVEADPAFRHAGQQRHVRVPILERHAVAALQPETARSVRLDARLGHVQACAAPLALPFGPRGAEPRHREQRGAIDFLRGQLRIPGLEVL